MKKTPTAESLLLRQKAEGILKSKQIQKALPLSETDILKLIHELQVHQVELEMQNEELAEAKKLAAELASDKYARLYDFAPSGYFTLSRDGIIIGSNLAGAAMLGVQRMLLANSRFSFFVSDDTKPGFQHFLENIFTKSIKASCEVTISANGESPVYIHLTGIIDEDKDNCLVTAVDITEHKSLEVLNEVLLASLPYPAMYIRIKDMVVLAVNKFAAEHGVKPGGHCWREFMKSESLSDEDKKIADKYPGIVPAEFDIKCTHCQAGDCFSAALQQNNPKVEAFGSKWDTYWIRVSNEVFLHYAVNISERAKAEEALQESERFLKETQEIGRIGTFSIDLALGSWSASEVLENIFGIDSGYDKSLKGWLSIVHPQWQQSLKDYYNHEVVQEKIKFDKEYKIIRPNDNTERWVHSIGRIEFKENNKASKIIGTITDITDRKLAEEALAESEERFRKVLQDIQTISVQGYAADGTTQYWNKASESLYGYTEQEAIGTNLLDLIIPPEMRADVQNAIRQMAETGEPIPASEMLLMHKNGSRIPVFSNHTIIKIPGHEQELFCIDINLTELKQAEEKIRLAHDRLRSFVDADIVGVVLANADGTLIETNNYYLNMLGYNRSEFEAGLIDWRGVTPPEWLYTDEIAIGEMRQKGICAPYEKEYVRKDGTRVSVLITGTLLPGPEENIAGFILDITERKRAEKNLIESQLRLNKSQEMAHLGSWELEIDTQQLIWSDEVYRMFGLLPQEFEATHEAFLQSVHPDDRDMLNNAYFTSVEECKDGYELEHRIIRKHTGEVRFVYEKCEHIRDHSGRIIRSIGMVHDITERRQAEDELKASETKFRELFETNTDGITIFRLTQDGPPTEILDMNENAARMVGYTKEEMLHLTPHSLEKDVTPEKLEKRRLDLLTKGHSNFETTIKHKNGHYIIAEIKVMVINYNNQPALMNIVRDITERKDSEIQLQKYAIELSKQIAEKDKFFSIIAHDLRGPFNGFLELTELMAEGSSTMSMDEIRKIALVMKKSATNLFRLLGNLLEWSRMQRGITTYEPKHIILKSKMNEIFAITQENASKKGIAFSYDIPEDMVVFADENMLEAIIRNLTANAVKFTSSGGTIGVSAKSIPGDSVEFAIKDSGIGMNQNMVDNLFNIDVNTSRKGTHGELSTGLGLIICKDFIEKHNGTLRIESETGKGSTFYFTMPGHIETSDSGINTLKNQAGTAKAENRKLIVLIAEDEETSDLLISIALNKISQEIFHAKTGVEAVDICRSHPDIDLIMMDIQMPEMNGYEATRQIRKFNKEVIIIAQTAYALSGERGKAADAGCNDYISKPISQKELLLLIREHIK